MVALRIHVQLCRNALCPTERSVDLGGFVRNPSVLLPNEYESGYFQGCADRRCSIQLGVVSLRQVLDLGFVESFNRAPLWNVRGTEHKRQ